MASAFDAVAADYDDRWESDIYARMQRRRVHELLAQQLPNPAHVLDLGCGTGTDARALVLMGHTVTAVDGSQAMCDHLAGLPEPSQVHRVDLHRPAQLPAGPFDAALSNFGALNCVQLEPVARALSTRLPPGAPLIIVLMSHVCPAELLQLLSAGRPVEALRRRRRGHAPVGPTQVPVHYPRPDQVRRAFAPHFLVEQVEALGLLLPPPGRGHRLPERWSASLDRLDRRVGRLPLLRSWGDHTAYLLRRATH